MILYMPNGTKLCLFTKSIRNFIAKRETKNETVRPIKRSKSSSPVAEKPFKTNFRIFNSDAPAMMGIAIKNENSALATRDTPVSIPPSIVEPDLDVPGTSDKTWNVPIRAASLKVSSSTEKVLQKVKTLYLTIVQSKQNAVSL